MSEIPVIRIEIERMRLAICAALNEHAVKVDAMVGEAIESYIATQLRSDLDRHVKEAISHAISKQTADFFSYGPGRPLIAKMIVDKLSVELSEER